MPSIRVVIADDDTAIRSALSDTLQNDPRFDVVAAVENGCSLAELVTTTKAHVALVDVRMPAGGKDALRALRATPHVVAIMISARTDATTVTELLREGAVGYFAKGRLDSTFPDLVARCVAGEVVLAVPSGAESMRRLSSGT